MRKQAFHSNLTLGLTLGVALAVAAAPAFAQAKYKAPRTPDGVPDIEGVYSNSSNVPLERPANAGAKEFYTQAEVDAQAKAAAAREKAPTQVGTTADIHYDVSQFGLGKTVTSAMSNLRTSLIVGPSGKVPPTLPEATKRQQAARALTAGHEYDGPENRGIAERCVYWGGEGPPMMPQGYNSNLQIAQGPGYVAIQQEMIHDVRIIPTDGRAHLDPSIRQWFGNSVGHWEGETLVVDTTNFNDQPALGRGASRDLHVVERFTRTGPETVLYQFTVSDPQTWETSWSGEYPMGKIKENVYEYACQEGNYGMANILSGARAEEKKAAQK